MICAANFGVAALISTSAPELCKVMAWLSIVGSVTSNDAVMIFIEAVLQHILDTDQIIFSEVVVLI
jgi:hypothetical protein